MCRLGYLSVALLATAATAASVVADGATLKQRLIKRRVDMAQAFDDYLLTNLEPSTSSKIMDSSLKLLRQLKKANRDAGDPCQNYIKIQFDTWWDEEEGDKWYNMSAATQPKHPCHPNATWLQPKVVDDEDVQVGDYEHLIALCPPMPECVPHSTRFYTSDETPRNGQQGFVTLVTNYVSSCKKYSSYKLRLEVKSCPTAADPFNEIYRLPEGCSTNNICSINQFGPFRKVNNDNKVVVG